MQSALFPALSVGSSSVTALAWLLTSPIGSCLHWLVAFSLHRLEAWLPVLLLLLLLLPLQEACAQVRFQQTHELSIWQWCKGPKAPTSAHQTARMASQKLLRNPKWWLSHLSHCLNAKASYKIPINVIHDLNITAFLGYFKAITHLWDKTSSRVRATRSSTTPPIITTTTTTFQQQELEDLSNDPWAQHRFKRQWTFQEACEPTAVLSLSKGVSEAFTWAF